VPIFLKSESLNLLEPLGPVKACNEIVFTSIQNLYEKELCMNYNLRMFLQYKKVLVLELNLKSNSFLNVAAISSHV
jgi:hypothetical protein